MHVEEFWSEGVRLKHPDKDALEGEGARLMLTALALNNDASVANSGAEFGDPTEIALLLAARRMGYEKDALKAATPRIAELPFDSDGKLMTTLHREDARVVAYTKGTPEKIIERCAHALQNSQSASFALGLK